MPREPYVQPAPSRRPLKIYAFDPMLDRSTYEVTARSTRTQVVVNVKNEPLERGPRGDRIEVIDYDGANNCYYEPIDLDDPKIAMQGGLDPTATDPRFHQQMVYGVAMNVLENFDYALGQRVKFRKNQRLRLFPHAFQAPNAFYDRTLLGILFGYFRADEKNPGPNLPGQIVYTCLSQDIIAHEMSHALVDRLRPYFLEPSNSDVPAFHEGFADIVAILQHFTFPGILRDVIQDKRGDLHSSAALVELAAQFGHASGSNRALRTAIDKPDVAMYRRIAEPHARGSILVGAVFDAFFTTYQRRIADLIRIATGGASQLPDADLHPDLVNRIAYEAARTAQQVLTMCIRAFDYLPPVDVTFGDYLRALITADVEIAPADEHGLRAAMIEGFRRRGIYAAGVASLAEDSVALGQQTRLRFPDELLEYLARGAREMSAATDDRAPPGEEVGRGEEHQSALAQLPELDEKYPRILHQWARQHRRELQLAEGEIEVAGFHTSYRMATDGSLKIELVAQFAQEELKSEGKLGGIPFRGGTTIVVSADGNVRYVIPKPLSDARRKVQQHDLEAADAADPGVAWMKPDAFRTRAQARMSFRALHQGRK